MDGMSLLRNCPLCIFRTASHWLTVFGVSEEGWSVNLGDPCQNGTICFFNGFCGLNLGSYYV